MVEAALLYYGDKKLLDNTPIPLNLEKDNDPRLLTSPLKFPGKLEVDVLNNRLFISDSNHNRIVSSVHPPSFPRPLSLLHICIILYLYLHSSFIPFKSCIRLSNYLSQVVTDLDGNFKMQVGSTGEEGLRDGNFEDAMFNRPQVIVTMFLTLLNLFSAPC